MSTDTTRRDLLAATAAIGAGELMPFVRPASARTREPLLDLKARYDETVAAAKAAYDAHTPYEDLFQERGGFSLPADRQQLLKAEIGLDKAEAAVSAAEGANFSALSEIAATPATSLVGMRIKAQVSHFESNLYPELIDSLIDDLMRMEA